MSNALAGLPVIYTPERETPAFIRERAKNRAVNHKLAQALRDAGIEPTGAAWQAAKAAYAKHLSIGAAVAAAHVC